MNCTMFLCVIDYCNIVFRKPVMDMRTCIIILHLNHTICPFPTPPPPPKYVEYLRPTNNDCSSRFGVSVLLTEILQNGANH